MKSPIFWAFIYLFMAGSFVFFAIQQKARTGQWDWFTILLVAVAAYDFMIAMRYFNMSKKKS